MPPVVIITEKTPPERDNIGLYVRALASAMRHHGCDVEVWSLRSTHCDMDDVPCLSFANYSSSLSKLYHLLDALRTRKQPVILWQYNPFYYGWKGIPSVLYALPLLAHAVLRCRVVLLFHEIRCPAGLYPPRSWVWAMTHTIALWLGLWGCDAAITTTPNRLEFVCRFARRFVLPQWAPRIYTAIPVGSTIPAPSLRTTAPSPDILLRIGTFRMGAPGQELTLLRSAYDELTRDGARVQLVVIGTGPPLTGSRGYDSHDNAPGIVETGFLPEEDASHILSTLDIFVGLYPDGASGRRTSLAVAFERGLCVVSTHGSDADTALFRQGENCLLVPYGDLAHLTTALRTLCADAPLRLHLGQAARRAYDQYLAWSVIAGQVMDVVTACTEKRATHPICPPFRPIAPPKQQTETYNNAYN